jgi:hypothetical protein
MKATEFDEIFDAGEEDVLQYADLSKAWRPNQPKRVNVDFPLWMVKALDEESERLGITRQALIKTWIGERLSGPGPVSAERS